MPRAFLTLVVPEGLLVLAAAACVQWPGALEPLRSALPYLPPIVCVAGAVLAVRFQRTDVVLALLILTAAGLALSGRSQPPGAATVVAALLPVNLTVLALLPERGLLSAAAGRRLTALAAQAGIVLILARPDQMATLGRLADRRLAGRLLPVEAAAGDVAVVLGLLGALILTVVLLRSRLPMHRGFLWALVASLLAVAAPPLRHVGGLDAPVFLLTIAALSLVIAVIETAHALAFRDALTGLGNRRALDDALQRTPGPFAIAMLDVDRFKQVNDTHGHDAGDQILRMVAGQVAAHCAPGRPYRYGGEEFAILFTGQNATDVLATLEGVREAVASAPFTVRGAARPRKKPKRPHRPSGATSLAVTISIGVAERRDDDAAPDGVVARADEALYRAKAGGRNRVEGIRRRSRA